MEDRIKKDYNYIKVFVCGFLIFGLTALISIIPTKGIWIYYGDFNVQQIPFYMHVHEAIRSGNFLYDFGTDLGGSILGQYSFYLTGSPFFWLTIPFPTDYIPYLMPWLTALKYAVMALTSYTYLKRHLETETGAFIGALLYTFSGFQGAVLVYNHFHDVMAFFPLYLFLFDRMIEKKKATGFALMTAFMLVLNYYFFVGEVVFLLIYFVMTSFFEPVSFKEKAERLLRAFFSGLTGVLLAGAYFLPAVYYTLGNTRLSDVLEGYDLVAYDEPTRLLAIIKNVVMLPDVSGLNSMLNLSGSRVSGVGAYIPLFSIAGVVAYFYMHKGFDYVKRILTASVIFAAFPVLNALFSALNTEFYARWYYMPVLFMALATASVLEHRDEAELPLFKGVRAVAIITFTIVAMGILPAKTDEGQWSVLGALKNYEQFITEIIVSCIMLLFLLIYVRKGLSKSDRVLRWIVMGACLLTAFSMFIRGTSLVDMDRKNDFITQALKGESPVEDDCSFYRIETDEDFYNYPLMWEGTHSITAFISTINNSTLDYYEALGIHRKVSSNVWTSRIGTRAILSGKYFLTNNMHSIEYIGRVEDMTTLKGYKLINQKNGFNIYENENYIPMGFTYDTYVNEEEFKESEITDQAKDRALIKVLVLPKEAGEKYGGLFAHGKMTDYTSISYSTFKKEAAKRRESACTEFETSTYGFRAVADMDKDNLLFFSVPYEKGFHAYVDGEETRIVKVDFGFMAVYVPKGVHEVEFKYELYGLKEGLYATLAGIVLLCIIIFVEIKKNRRNA